jgi:hypothetical protein
MQLGRILGRRYPEVPFGSPTIGASEVMLAQKTAIVNIYININYGFSSAARVKARPQYLQLMKTLPGWAA